MTNFLDIGRKFVDIGRNFAHERHFENLFVDERPVFEDERKKAAIPGS